MRGGEHVERYSPEETPDLALLETRDVNMPRSGRVEVKCRYVVAVDCARELRKVYQRRVTSVGKTWASVQQTHLCDHPEQA